MIKCDKCHNRLRIYSTYDLPKDNRGKIYRRQRYRCTGCGHGFETIRRLSEVWLWRGSI